MIAILINLLKFHQKDIIDQINKLIISILALLVNHLFHFIVVSDDIDLIEN